MICYDCHRWTQRPFAYVMDEFKHIVGFRCKKCVSKLYVKNVPIKFGYGWRQNLKDLIEAVKSSQDKQKLNNIVKDNNSLIKSDIEKESISKINIHDIDKNKPSMINKISSFFRRRTP